MRLSIKQQEKKDSSDEFLFPVGKVDSITVYPVSFEEYLMNVNPVLLKMIRDSYSKKSPLASPYHDMAMNLLHEYLTIGGLPEALDIFIQEKSYVEARSVLKEVYENYLGDMDTYNISTEMI